MFLSDAIKNSAKDLRLDPKVQAAIDAYDLDLDILDGDHIDEPVSQTTGEDNSAKGVLLP